jgi:hypothetical protein
MGEQLLKSVTDCFFGPLRCSVLLDANGANTTAAAAVLAAGRHLTLRGSTALVLGGTGPVGQRVVRLLAREGASVRVASRSAERAADVCRAVTARVTGSKLTPHAWSSDSDKQEALNGAQLAISAGKVGVEMISAKLAGTSQSLKVAIDLNAVPPLGIAGIDAMDKGKERDGVICYGALGVGGTKMKIHRAAIQRLFTANNLVLDAEEVFQIGQELQVA